MRAEYNAVMKVLGLLVSSACTAASPQHIVDSSGAPFALQADGTIEMVDGTPAAVPFSPAKIRTL